MKKIEKTRISFVIDLDLSIFAAETIATFHYDT